MEFPPNEEIPEPLLWEKSGFHNSWHFNVFNEIMGRMVHASYKDYEDELWEE